MSVWLDYSLLFWLQLIFGSKSVQVYCFLKKVEQSILLGSSPELICHY